MLGRYPQPPPLAPTLFVNNKEQPTWEPVGHRNSSGLCGVSHRILSRLCFFLKCSDLSGQSKHEECEGYVAIPVFVETAGVGKAGGHGKV